MPLELTEQEIWDIDREVDEYLSNRHGRKFREATRAFAERMDEILARALARDIRNSMTMNLCRTVGDPFAIDPASPPVVSSAPEARHDS